LLKINTRKSDAATGNLILFIDTSGNITKIALFDYGQLVAVKEWDGKGDLSETLLSEIEKLLTSSQVKLEDLAQIAAFPGPGSYTGLRIGITVANFLSWSLEIPVVAGEISRGKLSIARETNLGFILPKYLRPAHITTSRKSRF